MPLPLRSAWLGRAREMRTCWVSSSLCLRARIRDTPKWGLTTSVPTTSRPPTRTRGHLRRLPRPKYRLRLRLKTPSPSLWTMISSWGTQVTRRTTTTRRLNGLASRLVPKGPALFRGLIRKKASRSSSARGSLRACVPRAACELRFQADKASIRSIGLRARSSSSGAISMRGLRSRSAE